MNEQHPWITLSVFIFVYIYIQDMDRHELLLLF